MESPKSEAEKHISIQDLYPHLNDEQIKEAEENLYRYIELTVRMYDRIRHDPDAYARFKTLTNSAKDLYDEEGQRSKIKPRT